MFTADVFAPGRRLGRNRMANQLHLRRLVRAPVQLGQAVQVGKRIVKILRPQKGNGVFGRQVGKVKAKAVEKERDSRIWRHDAESFRRMWEVVGEETGTRWETWAELDVAEGMGERHWSGEEIRRLRFEV